MMAVDSRAIKYLEGQFSKGRPVDTAEAYYVLCGVSPSEITPDDFIGIAAGLGLNSFDGSDCPEALTKQQYEKLEANLEIVRKWNGRN